MAIDRRIARREVQQVADDIGSAGASTLKKCVTEAVNDYLAPIVARRTQYA